MRETADDVEELQALLDRSFDAAGGHLRSIFREEDRPSAVQLVDDLDDVFEMHLGTLAADGAPLVAPVDGVFFRGHIWFGLPGASLRSRLVRRDPRVSASFVAGSFAFIAHGRAVEIAEDDHRAAAFDDLATELYVARYGDGFLEWRQKQRATEQPGAGYVGFIEPRVLFAKR